MQFYRMSRYQKNKIKIKLSMTTPNYKLDTRYALVDTDIINDKKNSSIQRLSHSFTPSLISIISPKTLTLLLNSPLIQLHQLFIIML